MPDRFTAQRLIDAYKGAYPHPEIYEMDYDKRQRLFPSVGDKYAIIDLDTADAFAADLEALVEFAIDQALAGKLESL